MSMAVENVPLGKRFGPQVEVSWALGRRPRRRGGGGSSGRSRPGYWRSRYELRLMLTMWQWWRSRSSEAEATTGSPKTSPHSFPVENMTGPGNRRTSERSSTGFINKRSDRTARRQAYAKPAQTPLFPTRPGARYAATSTTETGSAKTTT